MAPAIIGLISANIGNHELDGIPERNDLGDHVEIPVDGCRRCVARVAH